MSLEGIFYSLYNIVGNAIFGALPDPGTSTDLVLTFFSFFMSICVLLVPFFVAWYVLKLVFGLFFRWVG